MTTAANPRLAPHLYAVSVLNERLYLWQAAIMHDVWTRHRTTARCCNGSGKTSKVVSALALAVADQFKGATVVIVSATNRQVRDQIFPAIRGHEPKYPNWDFGDSRITTDGGSRIIGFSTDHGGRFEGYHSGGPDKPLLIIVDEAKTVADDIFVAIDRCQPDMLLYISSPGGRLGRFHESFSLPHFRKHVVGADQCPHINPAFIAEMGQLYGTDSEIYRSMVLGEFATGDDDGHVIPFGAVESCLRNPPYERDGDPVGFCDFAETSDENVLAVLRGNRVVIEEAWVQTPKSDGQPDKDAVVARFKAAFRRCGLKAERIWGDASGMGYGYAYALRNDGWAINTCENSDAPIDPHYFNLGAESWWKARELIEQGGLILPRDDVLKKQLCARLKVWRKGPDGKPIYGREDGRLQLEPKSTMRGKSPDRADAVVGAVYWAWRLKIGTGPIGRMGDDGPPSSLVAKALQERDEESQQLDYTLIPGAFTG